MKIFYKISGLILLIFGLCIMYFIASDYLINTLDIIAALISIFGLIILLLVLVEIIKIKIIRILHNEDLFKQEQDTDNKEV
jgi:hypothetical protein